MFIARQPMGRLAKAEEIAPIVVFLASDEARVRHRQHVFSVRWRHDHLIPTLVKSRACQPVSTRLSTGEHMKLVRYGPAGKEKPGLIDADGKLRDLSKKVKDIDGAIARAGGAREAQEARPEEAAAGQGPAAARSRASRCRRSSSRSASTTATTRRNPASPIPEHPVVFFKSTTCIVGPNDNVMVPRGLDAARLGGRARRRDRPHGALRRREGRAQATSPATASSTTCPSASSR